MLIKRAAQDALLAAAKTPEPVIQEAPVSAAPAPYIEMPLIQEAPKPDWTAEHVASGVAPDRRQEKTASERRRSYRRVEDRDLISKAHEEATAIKEHAHSLGFQEGLDQAQASIDELHEFISSQMTLREQALESVAKDIAELAVEVAARIIKTEVSCDDMLVMSLVRDTIQKSTQGQRGKGNKHLLIKVNPDDVALVKQQLKSDANNEDFQGSEIVVMGDSNVDEGSCILETDNGMIDASFSTQLGILSRLFKGTSKQAGSN